ncbi:MAG TPA: energy transducer TonB [Longimicrobiales bacterium]|nr:energy transducer TonB [Longimicrobiales bacterium]
MKSNKLVWVFGALMACGEAPDQSVELPQRISDAVPFAYPLTLWDNNIQGQTDLALRISQLGVVDSVVISRSSGYAEFDSAAVQGARNMKFTPGKKGQQRVAMWTKLPVRFTRDTLKMGLTNE